MIEKVMTNEVMSSPTGICNGHIHQYNEIYSPPGTNHSNHWCGICGLSFEKHKVKTCEKTNHENRVINYDGETFDCIECGLRNEPLTLKEPKQ